MKKLTQEEELLVAIFEGPVRPLTEEDQKISHEADQRYEERKRIRYERYALLLNISVEQIGEMEKVNPLGLIEKVAYAKVGRGSVC